jgi:hypothetical protein
MEADPDAPVPAGYDSVAWLRPYEAGAVITSYRHRQDAPVRHNGKVRGWARFHAIDSPDARKRRANVRIDHVEPAGPRVVCWVRQNEAKAIIHAASTRQDSPFEDRQGSHEGMVQYFLRAVQQRSGTGASPAC